MKKSILAAAFLLVTGFTTAWANDGDPTSRKTSGQVHNILSNQLPVTLSTDIKKDYKDYWITDLYVDLQNKRPSYYITVENADQVVKLTATDRENWVVTSTTVKGMM